MSKKLLCDTDHVIAIDQDFGGDDVVVTFNNQEFIRNDLRFWGDAFFLKQRMSAIGIVTPKPNWYPRRSMDKVIASIRERTNGRKIFTCGYSQGGYGALKYSAGLRASAALAFCPQWSINPTDVSSFDSRFELYFDEALNNGLNIEKGDLCACAFIVFDKMQTLDRAHVAKIVALNGVKSVVSPFGMADVVRLGPEGGSAARLIDLCRREPAPEPTELRQVIRASRAQSRSYLNHMVRQLIFRMSQSRGRSSGFVSGLLAKKKIDNPLYSAFISQANGDASLARSELSKAAAKHFENIDLVPLLRLANGLHFVEAERALGTHIFGRYPANTQACLLAVDTLTRVGNAEDAHRELSRIAKHSDAANYAGKFIEFALKLQKPDVIETILSRAATYLERVALLFLLLDFYRSIGDRSNAFQKAMDLERTCAESPTDLRRVAGALLSLGEFVFALEILERLLRGNPGDYLLALDVVEVKFRIVLNKNRSRANKDRVNKERASSELKKLNAELGKIVHASDLPTGAWERASYLFESLGDDEAALYAIKKATECVESEFGARQRLVVLLTRKGRTRSAKRELSALLAKFRGDSGRLRILGKLAINLRDWNLAKQFAEAQFQCEPTDPHSILYLARQLRIVGDRSRAHYLLSSLFHKESCFATISDEHWIWLAEELYEVGDVVLTKKATAEVLARDPNSVVARRLGATIDLLEKFGKSTLFAAPRGHILKRTRLGLASRLSKFFRR